MRSSCSASASARQLQLRATRQQQLKQQLSGSASSPAAAAAHSRTAARLKQHEGATSAALARPRLLLDSTCLSSQRATGGERLTEEFVARGDAEQQHASPSAESGLGSELLGSLWALLDDCRAPAVAAALTSSLAAGALLFPEAASAEYVAAVDKAQAGDILLNVFGIAFTVTFALFLLRVLNKRASRATTIKLARDRLNEPDARDLMSDEPVTPLNCLGAAAAAVVISIGLWNLTQFVDGLFLEQPASDQYAVKNITNTIRTVVTGLMYLATFLFGANAIGLTGLAFQMIATGKANAGSVGSVGSAGGQQVGGEASTTSTGGSGGSSTPAGASGAEGRDKVGANAPDSQKS